MRRSVSVIALFVVIAVLVIAGIVLFEVTRVKSAINGDAASGPAMAVDIGGPFTLTNQAGQPVTEALLEGHYSLIYFGYSYCPDVCPTDLGGLAAALDLMGEAGAKAQLVFVTIDPERDTVDVLADYVPLFHERLIGLTGTARQIADIARAYHVYYTHDGDPHGAGYLMTHSSFVYLMGPQGQYLTMFRGAAPADEIAQTVRDYIAAAPSS